MTKQRRNLIFVGGFATLMIIANLPEGSSDGPTGTVSAVSAASALPDSNLAALRDSVLQRIGDRLHAQDFGEAEVIARANLTREQRSGAAEDAAWYTDSLRVLLAIAEEARLYAEARALPGSNAVGNAQAYRELATRFPNSERSALYREKASSYEARVERERRAAMESAFRPSTGSSSRACCRRCSRGKPCGDSCIARNRTCRRGPGCAC